MSKNSDDLNIQWKNSSVGSKEKSSRRINEQSALKYKAYKKNSVLSPSLVTPADLPKSIHKKDNTTTQFVDDNNDNVYQIASDPNLSPSSNNLELEKQPLLQKSELEQMERQHKAEKLGILQTADKFAESVGLKKIKSETSAALINDISSQDDLLAKSINYDIKKRLKIKGKKIKPFAVNDFFLGIKRIESIAGKSILKGMNAKEIIDAGKTKNRDSKICKIILKKTGRKLSRKKISDKKKLAKAQNEFNKIVSKNALLRSLEKSN